MILTIKTTKAKIEVSDQDARALIIALPKTFEEGGKWPLKSGPILADPPIVEEPIEPKPPIDPVEIGGIEKADIEPRK